MIAIRINVFGTLLPTPFSFHFSFSVTISIDESEKIINSVKKKQLTENVISEIIQFSPSKRCLMTLLLHNYC